MFSVSQWGSSCWCSQPLRAIRPAMSHRTLSCHLTFIIEHVVLLTDLLCLVLGPCPYQYERDKLCWDVKSWGLCTVRERGGKEGSTVVQVKRAHEPSLESVFLTLGGRFMHNILGVVIEMVYWLQSRAYPVAGWRTLDEMTLWNAFSAQRGPWDRMPCDFPFFFSWRNINTETVKLHGEGGGGRHSDLFYDIDIQTQSGHEDGVMTPGHWQHPPYQEMPQLSRLSTCRDLWSYLVEIKSQLQKWLRHPDEMKCTFRLWGHRLGSDGRDLLKCQSLSRQLLQIFEP